MIQLYLSCRSLAIRRTHPRRRDDAGGVFRWWLLVVAAVLTMAACQRDDDDDSEPQPPQTVEQTVVVFMPWAQNLLPFFQTNINDWAEAVAERLLASGQERVVVCLAESSMRSRLIELRQVQDGRCRRDTLQTYDWPDYTQAADISRLLTDAQLLAPARRYGMVIGSHGMGWLPAGQRIPTRRAARQATASGQWQPWPLTRWFGGTSAQYQIDLTTLRDGIKGAGLRMEYVLFDDCYMSSVEAAYTLRTVTDYLVACPTEIMAYGLPYRSCARHLVGPPDYKALCQTFLDFYTAYAYPYATIAVTDCRELEALASTVADATAGRELTDSQRQGLQVMDGYEPTLFYDLGDYVAALCDDDPMALARFQEQLERTVPHKAHTPQFYSYGVGPQPIRTYSGLTTSAPSQSTQTEAWSQTEWAQAVTLYQ